MRKGLLTRVCCQLVFLVCVAVLGSTSFIVAAQQKQRAVKSQTTANKKVRLVVGIVIDQLRQDYLQRFEDQFCEGGFKRMMTKGAVFTNANYIHSPTVTACGHGTFMTGATPALNGIVGNEWYDRATGARVTSVSDNTVKLLGGREGNGMSPRKMFGSTIGDELKLASAGRAKVIGVSYKDRSAILPAGHQPNGAYWFDASAGNFVSSTYYFADLPEWVKKFNREMNPSRFFGKKWEKLLPDAAYQRSAPDDAPYEKWSYGTKFPYTINGGEEKPGSKFYNQFEYTPYANEQLVSLAKAAIENEGLGADDMTDLLTVSFSANDLLGHYFGPYSQEVQDMTLRTDQTLAEFFDYLDKRIGLDQVVVVLTADHGVAPVPEQVKEYGYGGRLEAKSVTDAIEAALDQRFADEKWILSFVNGNVYFDEAVVEKHKLKMEDVEQVAAAVAMKVPGISACFTRTQIISGNLPRTMIPTSVANGFYSPRNGNLVVVTQPFFFIGEGVTTTHGSPYSYDTHVPVILMGAGMAAGAYPGVSSPADIAPTLAALLKIETPSNSVGRILSEALKK